jgi:hypothetical protein
MDEALSAQLREISETVDGLQDEIEQALDEHAEFAFGLATRVKVEALSARYRALVATLDEKTRMQADRTTGRKVVDVQRMANRLPSPPAGAKAHGVASREFFETREGKSSRQPVVPGLAPGESAPPRDGSGARYKVTGDVEAWCGPCADLKTHTIIAMVGDEPAQVVCQRCGSRHKFRTAPARGKKDAAAPASKASSAPATPTDRRLAERNALVAELRAAETVKPFSPKDRYKVGEIIDHPEHGRGKIENTLSRSLLVRFPSGLRPLKLG